MNVNTTTIENLAIGGRIAFSLGRFGIEAKRVDDKAWTFTLIGSQGQLTDTWSQVFSRNGQTFTAHADYDNGESFTSQTEHHAPHSAIADAVGILILG